MGRPARRRPARRRRRLSRLPACHPALPARGGAGADRVWRFGGRCGRCIVQDALLTIHRVRHTYEPGRPVKPWLAAIASRRAIDAMRRRGRQAAREVHNPGAYETFADPVANRDEASEAKEALGQMMAELTPRQKEALDLTKLKEMSLAEASAASGQSIASLKVNMHRAIKKLRLGLGGDAPE